MDAYAEPSPHPDAKADSKDRPKEVNARKTGSVPDPQTSIVLKTEGLTKRYGAFVAADSIDLSVRRGEVYGFLGPNGSGKTTTIGMILGLLHPSSGSATVLGERVTPARNGALRRVGTLVGTPSLIPDLSGRQNLELARKAQPELSKTRVDEVLERVGLLEHAKRKTGAYSMGMKQRLGLGLALLHKPELLILDEPTNGLDPAGMKEVRDLLRNLADDGTTVFLSSHLLHEIQAICDRVTMLRQGKVVTEGSVQDLLSRDKATVRVRVADLERGIDLLSAWPEASAVRVNGGQLEVETADSGALILYLVQQNLVPSEVALVKPDLESVFLELTQ